MFWATKSCFRHLNKNVNLSLMVSCQDDLISPTVILCSLNQTLSSSFSSHLQSFSCFTLFYFLVHISASFVILPRPFPVFFFSLSLPFLSPSLLFTITPLSCGHTSQSLVSGELKARGERRSHSFQQHHRPLILCRYEWSSWEKHSLTSHCPFSSFPVSSLLPLLSRPSPLENLNLSFIASPLVKLVFLCS